MAPRTRSRRPVVLTVVVALVLGLGAAATLTWCSVLGCSLFREPFRPDGETARFAREEARATVVRLVSEASGHRDGLASTLVDGCVTGQNSWKRKDPYAHECSYVVSQVVPLVPDGDADAVGAALDAADDAVRALGCDPASDGGLAGVRDEYLRPGNPNVVREGAAGLPAAHYDCPDGVALELDPTSSRLDPAAGAAALGTPPLPDTTLAGSWYDDADVAAVRDADLDLALVVTGSRTYYRTRF